jgi:hypothetical protein
MTRIRQEGFRNSKVMETLSELTDRFGPRVTGSPNLKRANEWTRDQFEKWGLANAHLENWGPFGRGWTEEFTSVRMMTPDVAMLHAVPRAWTPGTNGIVRGKVLKLKATTKEDLDKYKGKLGGMIVLTAEPPAVKAMTEPLATRYTDQRLQEIAAYGIPGERSISGYGGPGSMTPEEMRRRMEFSRQLQVFLNEEKPLAVIEPSRYDEGLVTMSGVSGGYRATEGQPAPVVPMLNSQPSKMKYQAERPGRSSKSAR